MLKSVIVTVSILLALAAAEDTQELADEWKVIGEGIKCLNAFRGLANVS